MARAGLLQNPQMQAILRGMEENSRHWLHRMGLARYEPGKQAAIAIGFLIAGGILGTAAGLLMAPKTGRVLRYELQTKAKHLMAPLKAKEPSVSVEAQA